MLPAINTTTLSVNTELYTRSKKDCYEIDISSGLHIYELLGKQNGNSAGLSIAIEEFVPGGSSPAHFHSNAEEYQVILEGTGKLVIGNEKRTVTVGDLIRIPPGMTHQTFNKSQENPLKLCCYLTPSWSAEDTTFTDQASSTHEEVYMCEEKNCVEINEGKGETIYELLGKENGSSENLSIALVKIEKGYSSELHFHPEAEENYVIVEGQGRIVIDGQTRIVTRDDLVNIPKGKIHQIFNDNKETLKFYCACQPAWTPNCFIKV